ncbi:MAG TPA: MaoC/PaaZ C-terminal domain-containing protein [Burkholderiales bacterium]|nr:MaoC/PaaZ C-terminal domain-containing protein [Burkholderiales bacterium]
MATVEVAFAADHPAARGHFPGNPIIPGALLLSEALRAMESDFGNKALARHLKSAKFTHPVRPGDRVSIDFSVRGDNVVRFSCAVGSATVLAGELVCEALPKGD